MTDQTFLKPLETLLKLLAGFILAMIGFQTLGVVMFLGTGAGLPTVTGEPAPTGVALALGVAFVLAVLRSLVWVRIYWRGAAGLSILRTEGDSPELGAQLRPILKNLKWLLVASCALDFLFLPAYFMTDVVLPFPLSGWRLGLIELARLLIPQAFGFAALILAFLAHQYGRLLADRGRMQHELELTI